MKQPKHFICYSLIFFTSLLPLCQIQHHNTFEQTAHLDDAIKKGDYVTFTLLAEKNPLYNASRNKLLYNLDTGIAEVFIGNYRSGTDKLIKTLNQSENYYTKSISRHVLSVLTNDLSLPYYGEDYEITFAGTITALAFASIGEIEDALVEIRKSEHRLLVMSDTYESTDKYNDDAFAHYLAGSLYEVAGKYNDAAISFKRAAKVYGSRFFPMKPEGITPALLKTSQAAGIDPGIKSDLNTAALSNEMATNVIVTFVGRGPMKEEVIMRGHFTDNGIDHVVKIAIPVIKSRNSSIRNVRLTVDDASMLMDYAADYNLIGTDTFNEKKSIIYAKTLARVSSRYLIIKASKEKTIENLRKKYEKEKEEHGENSDEAGRAWLKLKAASVSLDILANELLERADIRNSLMLPGQVYICRISLPQGTHRITMEYLDETANVISKEIREIETGQENGAVEMFTALF